MAITVQTTLDLSGLEDLLLGHQEENQELFAMRAAFLMRDYVPMDEAILRNSEPLNSDYRAGDLVWNTPYAAKQYYVPQNHTTPGTTDHWDRAMMAQRKDDLLDFATALLEGRR